MQPDEKKRGRIPMKSFLKLCGAMLVAIASLAAALAPTAAMAKSRYLQCVPFAREVSGVEIYGNAKTWWGQAAGRYERGQEPKIGAVMAMPAHGKMRLGHVATVSQIVSDREVLLTHANWSRRGGIERNVRAIDVSAAGDWSLVKVWFAGNGDLGTTNYPVSGFIYPNRLPSALNATVQIAAAMPRVPLMLSDEVRAAAAQEEATSTL